MFEELFVQGDRRQAAKVWAFPLSLAVHAFLAALLVVLPLLKMGQPPLLTRVTGAFLSVPLPPSPPPPPARRARGRAGRIKPVRAGTAVDSGRWLAPVSIPASLLDEDLAGLDGGVEGGLEGGVPGGALNSVLGPLLEIVAGDPEIAVRAGGAFRPPCLLRRVEPEYPEIARQARVAGVVIIEAETDPTGRVIKARVLRSIPLLDAAALDAVRLWVYEPMIFNGRPRGVVFTVTVRFTLN
jgi:protein TonB